MRCARVKAQCSAYVDGGLSPSVFECIGQHLRECTSCWQLVQDELSIREELSELPSIDPPATLYPAIRSELDRRGHRPRRWQQQWLLRPWALGGLTSVVIAVFVIGGLWLRVEDTNPAAPQTQPLHAASPFRLKAPSPLKELVPALQIGDEPDCDLADTHIEEQACEQMLVDQTYREVADELREMIAESGRPLDVRAPAVEQQIVVRQTSLEIANNEAQREVLAGLQWMQIDILQRSLLSRNDKNGGGVWE